MLKTKIKWYIGDTKTETGERQIYICNTLLKILEGYKQRQTINKKRCGTDYYSHYLEEVKNKYGKITEYGIIEVRGKVRLSNKINLVFVNKKGKYSGTDSIRYTEETRKKANEFLEKTIQSEVIKKIINFEEFLQKD